MAIAVTILVVAFIVGTAVGFILPRRMPPGWLGMMSFLAIATIGVMMSPSTGLLVALFTVGVAVGRHLSSRPVRTTVNE